MNPSALPFRRRLAVGLRGTRWRLGLVAIGALLVVVGSRQAASARSPRGNPLSGLTRSRHDDAPLVGRVVERLATGSYTYLAVELPDAEPVWVVMLGRGPAPGARVRVRSLGRRTDFHSPRLGRTFPELIFGVISPAD